MMSCASVSVSHMISGSVPPVKLPEKIYLEKFEALPIGFQVNRRGKNLSTLMNNEQTQLANDIIIRLNKYVAPTVLLKADEVPSTGNFWLLRGSFQKVHEGSRLLRAAIGLGFGKTKMETNVQLIDLSRPGYDSILLTLQTTGGSGMAPGAITAFTPIGPFVLSNTLINAGGSLGGALGSGISIDRCRTAREIVAAISQYCVQEHLISKKKGLHPKQLGKLPYFFMSYQKIFSIHV